MKAIIAVNNLGFIGLNNKLPWKCSEDLEHFKNLTPGYNLLAGYKTFQSMKFLSLSKENITIKLSNNRTLSTDSDINTDEFVYDIFDWIVGGKKTYEKYCHLFDELHISHIDDNTIGDCLFPNLSNLNSECKIFNYYFKTE